MTSRKRSARAPIRRYKVFVSHSSRDRWIARQVARCVEEVRGATVSIDEKDLQGGDRIDDRVKQLIRECDELVVVYSSATAQSDWVKAEIGAAWVLEKRIVVVLDKLSPKDVPPMLDQHKMVDLNDIEAYFESLGSRARRRR